MPEPVYEAVSDEMASSRNFERQSVVLQLLTEALRARGYKIDVATQ